MAVLLLLLLLAVAGVVLVLQRSRRRLGSRPLPLRERTLFDLRLGDIVQADARDWVVEDRLIYEEDGFQWLEYLVRDRQDARWLVVCEDDWLEVSWLETMDFRPPRPLPQELTWQGNVYTLREQGEATVTATARTMNRRPGRCRYADYVAREGRLLGAELWGVGEDQEVEVSVGWRIDPSCLTLLPGDGRSVYR
ncbi:DUF4178 domain-containing protein [Cyanobium sp. Morenito 9A2]|uniref:DUF4178 domain-containing protein n=1 Tax=Cyanobium sp. Morenito 9A2 TaxID=2823718 RepID=UPI0020CEBBDD|nr:DUF4178 domain-containing protein [Cyanobium sp. Morenito 9A2]MCP9848924.1 DUF4178 domain-containing protein [Cyanobium sp. Morenito 9A2]